MNEQKVVWVMSLPQIKPAFVEDQRERDGCMMSPLTWPQRLVRQAFPRRGTRDCCYYHRQDFHAIAAAVIEIHQQIAYQDLTDEETDEAIHELLAGMELTEDERRTAWFLLLEDCGIQLWRPEDKRRWLYREGRHRTRALMDAGVRRIVVTLEDDRRHRD